MGKLKPRELSFADTAPYKISTYYDSPASPTAIFKLLSDHRGALKWIGSGVTNIEPTSNPETGVGCTRTNTFLYGLGKLEEIFIAWEEPKIWSFTGTSFRPGLFSGFLERIILEPIGNNGCRINYRLALDIVPIMRPLSRMMLRILNWQAPRVLKKMSEAAEKLQG